MFQLRFENQVFSKTSDFEQNLEGLPDFAKESISFCKFWLNGTTEFNQQTSGSTGIPKTIRISRSQFLASAKGTGEFFQMGENSRILCCLNPAYIAGKMMLVRAMVWNCELVLVEPNSDPLKNCSGEFDLAAFVPLQVEGTFNNPESLAKLKSIKNLIIGGAPLSSGLKQKLISSQISAYQTYGMTETVSHIALARIEAGEMLYKTLPGVIIGKDERGALWVLSEMGGPEKIQTNDRIELFSPNSFHWLGRVDFVINSGGIKHFPEELEQKIEPLVDKYFPNSRFFIFGESDEKLGEKIVLLVERKENQKSAIDLLEDLKNVLNKYEIPKAIYLRTEFAETPTGKIDRKRTFANP
ncbi:O-succinylbenzoic acid--CoA ligase [Algoriphagus boseongensis]|uniref:O-succinylbenzoic acid--CoA ligase n=1 Tax=Algoriphagus boseongensis TaxID=1442587 RepID=A0A4R6T8Q7_9BACT|nr:AMP-binding protein [Algoriphagus boseongensis]TDQ19420.1 O-succinylbenzoic acid--CoA ligase [Algoriphagus boseongensis]